MKKHLITAVLAIVAVGAVYAGQVDTKKQNKSLALEDVYTQVDECQAPTVCSDNDNNAPCIASATAYYLEPGCANQTTDFIYLP